MRENTGHVFSPPSAVVPSIGLPDQNISAILSLAFVPKEVCHKNDILRVATFSSDKTQNMFPEGKEEAQTQKLNDLS